MEDIRASAEVQVLVGDDLLRRTRSEGGQYECPRCGQPGDTGMPTSLSVLQHDNYPELMFAHAECMPSAVLRPRGRLVTGADADIPRPYARVRAAVLERGPGQQAWPALLHQLFEPDPQTIFPGRQAQSGVIGLVKEGLALLADGRGVSGLGPAAGWRLELRGSRARLVGPDGSMYYTGRWEAPGGWEELAGERGGCLLLSGFVGLHERRALVMPVGELARILDRAARDGTVAGGIVPVARG